MEPMTPEERLIRMDNVLQSLVDSQVQLQAQQAALQAQQAALTETQIRHETEIDKNTAAIRDLIVVSRTLVDSQKEVTAQIDKLREAQQAADEKIHILVETVDRIIRQQNL